MIPWGSLLGGGLGALVGSLIPGGTLIGAGIGASLGGGIDSSNAVGDASRAQQDAADRARASLQPYSDIGLANLRTLNTNVNNGAYRTDMSNWQTDPGYAFRQQQGLNAINANGAASGMRFSGATMKALEKYGQNFASNEYSNVYNRKQSENTNAYNQMFNLAQMGQNSAAGMADNAIQAGNAQSAGIIGQQNAVNNTVGNLSQMGMLYGMGAFNKSNGMGAGAQTAQDNDPWQTSKW